MRWELGLAAATVFMLALPLAAQFAGGRVPSTRKSRLLALGDSYTIGEGVDALERWPVQLARMLREQGADVADPEIVARTGWTTDQLKAGISAAAPEGPFELVTLLIGVNNQYRGRPTERYREEFSALLAQAIEFAGGKAVRVVVLSIPDWGVTPFAAGQDRGKIGREIDSFNAINREETNKSGAHYVDVTPVSREAREEWTTADGLHPSGRQYRRWAELATDPAAQALKY